MAEAAELEIEWTAPRRGRTGTLLASLGDEKFTDRLDLAREPARRRIAAKIAERWPAIPEAEVLSRLDDLGFELAQQEQAEEAEATSRPSAADLLVSMGRGCELFHPLEEGDEGFATTPAEEGGPRETYRLRSSGFRSWLARAYFQQQGRGAGSAAIEDALATLTGLALHEGAALPVATRRAWHDGELWLDLADNERTAVRVTADGWSIVPDAVVPVRFVRPRGMLSLPPPAPGGSLDELRALVNLPDSDSWVLYAGFLVSLLNPSGPYWVLVVNGEQGSAKSSACRFARFVVDPAKPLLRRPPRNEEDLLISAGNSLVVALDNVSGFSAAMSDALCSLSTGSGLTKRQLYSDAEEVVLDVQRPVLVNGIGDVCHRLDLVDRTIMLTLPPLAGEEIAEKVLLAKAEAARPRILGALLDAASAALRNLDRTELSTRVRMADAARWVVAAEPALPWAEGSFLSAYLANRAAASSSVLEQNPVGPALLALVEGRPEGWTGTAAELLEAIEEETGAAARKRPDWPKTARALSAQLDRLAPSLRRQGVEFERRREGHARRRLFTVRKVGEQPSAPSAKGSVAATVADGADGLLRAFSDEQGREWTG